MSPDLVDALRELRGEKRSIAARTRVFRRGDAVVQLFLVEEGEIRLQRDDVDGNSLVLQRARAGTLLAEASLHVSRYHCDAIATSSSRALVIGREEILTRFRNDSGFAELWSRALADDVRETRVRNELLRLRTVRARLDAWLAWQESPLPAHGARHALAHELGVTPEALYREIARRRKSTAQTP